VAFNITKKKFDPALSVTVKFLIIGILWIVFSDSLLDNIGRNNFFGDMPHIQYVKGILFVGVTAGVIFTILHNYTQTIKSLKREQEYFFKYNPIPMILVDSFSFRFKEANEAAIRLLGYSPSEIRSLSVYQLIFPEDLKKFESVLLFIKTGFDRLGSWKFKCRDGTPLYANISSKAIREKQMFLICFQDIKEQVKIEEELRVLNNKLQFEVRNHTQQLETKNEELAYRASQTQHINEELILVNEQLLSVNKRVVAERDEAILKILALEHLAHVTLSFDLTNKTKNFISLSAEDLFEEDIDRLNKPWFWLDFVHSDDVAFVSTSEKNLTENHEAFCIYRIISKKGNLKFVFHHLKLITKSNGNNVLIGSMFEVSPFIGVLSNPPQIKVNG
jgi:PAS domain S-box-containing protein